MYRRSKYEWQVLWSLLSIKVWLKALGLLNRVQNYIRVTLRTYWWDGFYGMTRSDLLAAERFRGAHRGNGHCFHMHKRVCVRGVMCRTPLKVHSLYSQEVWVCRVTSLGLHKGMEKASWAEFSVFMRGFQSMDVLGCLTHFIKFSAHCTVKRCVCV